MINTGVYCSNGGTVSLSGVAIGGNATVIVGNEPELVVIDDDE